MSFQKAMKHLATVNKHRRQVRKNCFRMGLYWQGLTHDLSKYTWPEFRIGAKYYMEDQSPHNGERAEYGYSTAWLHHKGRNKHHYEYWIDYPGGGKDIAGMKMPVKYVVEMFCDRVAACKNYNKEKYTDADPLNYYYKGRAYYVIHDDSDKLLLFMLKMLAEKGEDYTFSYIKKNILR